MKKFIIICAVAALGMACQKNDDLGTQVSNDTIYEFNDRFPGAKGVSWEKRGIYKVAVFSYNGQPLTAWYQQDGDWCMTEKKMNDSAAPTAVMNAYRLVRTGSAAVSHVDQLTRLGVEEKGNKYQIEDIYVVVTDAGSEYYFSADGILVKTIDSADRSYEDYRNEIVPSVPAQVFSTVKAHYPAGRVMEVDVIFPGIIYVDVIDNLVVKTMEFSLTGSWSMTCWEVSEQYLKTQEPTVYEAYQGLEYTDSCTVDYIECYRTPSLVYYWLHLDNNGTETNVKISEDGQVIVVN